MECSRICSTNSPSGWCMQSHCKEAWRFTLVMQIPDDIKSYYCIFWIFCFQNIYGTTRKDFYRSWFGFARCIRLSLQKRGFFFLFNFGENCRPCDRWLPAHEVDLFVWVCKREKKIWSPILGRAAVFRAVIARAPQPAVRLPTNHSYPVLWPTNGKTKVMFGTQQL